MHRAQHNTTQNEAKLASQFSVAVYLFHHIKYILYLISHAFTIGVSELYLEFFEDAGSADIVSLIS